MTEPAIQAIEQKLDDVLAQLRGSTDPQVRRTLLGQMPALMAELDRPVLDPTRFPRSDPK